MIFLINDDVAGLILRVKGMGAFILHFVAAIIASAKRIREYYHFNCMLQHASSQSNA
jgi:hypothetical protein